MFHVNSKRYAKTDVAPHRWGVVGGSGTFHLTLSELEQQQPTLTICSNTVGNIENVGEP